MRIASSLLLLVGCTSGAANSSPHALIGGAAAGSCDFPNVVYVRHAGGYCTGALVHPRFVVTAAHCTAPSSVGFGEAAGALRATINVLSCAVHPGYEGGLAFDAQICELQSTVTDVPIVPLLSPCEAASLPEDVDLAMLAVGFGDPAPASKRWGPVTGRLLLSGLFLRIDSGLAPGDSGGPTFLQLADGTWRQVGIHQRLSGDTPVPPSVAFFEASSGVDLTPCSAADGTPVAGPGCGGFVTELRTAGAFPGCAAPVLGPVGSAACTGPTMDAGAAPDVGSGGGAVDAGAIDARADAGTAGGDAAGASDVLIALDASRADAGARADGGAPVPAAGCACGVARRVSRWPSIALALLALLVAAPARRRFRVFRSSSP